MMVKLALASRWLSLPVAVAPYVPGVSVLEIVNGTLNVNESVRLAEESLPLVTAPLPLALPHETHRQLVTRP